MPRLTIDTARIWVPASPGEDIPLGENPSFIAAAAGAILEFRGHYVPGPLTKHVRISVAPERYEIDVQAAPTHRATRELRDEVRQVGLDLWLRLADELQVHEQCLSYEVPGPEGDGVQSYKGINK